MLMTFCNVLPVNLHAGKYYKSFRLSFLVLFFHLRTLGVTLRQAELRLTQLFKYEIYYSNSLQQHCKLWDGCPGAVQSVKAHSALMYFKKAASFLPLTYFPSLRRYRSHLHIYPCTARDRLTSPFSPLSILHPF